MTEAQQRSYWRMFDMLIVAALFILMAGAFFAGRASVDAPPPSPEISAPRADQPASNPEHHPLRKRT